MYQVNKMQLSVIVLAALVTCVLGHGRVMQPISRASAWRLGLSRHANYDDNGLNCGGFYHQWGVNGGRCGICGDPYDAPLPRNHEIGGTYGDGTIHTEYSMGDIIDTTVDITAYHMGYWEFRLCVDPLNNNQECFDEYILETENGDTKYPAPSAGSFNVKYRLPKDLTCEHCVLQWKYTCGNNWGVCSNGTQGIGCGNQETFWACSDISIKGSSESVQLDITPENSPLNLN